MVTDLPAVLSVGSAPGLERLLTTVGQVEVWSRLRMCPISNFFDSDGLVCVSSLW
jgi:hypothetical protein